MSQSPLFSKKQVTHGLEVQGEVSSVGHEAFALQGGRGREAELRGLAHLT